MYMNISLYVHNNFGILIQNLNPREFKFSDFTQKFILLLRNIVIDLNYFCILAEK